jgi:hypothetical protein
MEGAIVYANVIKIVTIIDINKENFLTKRKKCTKRSQKGK